jgi:hypothetical protein
MTKQNEAFATDANALKVVDRNISATKKTLEAIIVAWSENTNGAPLTMDELRTWYDWHQTTRPLKMDAIKSSVTRALIGSHTLYGEVKDSALLEMTGKDKHDMTDFITALKLMQEYNGWHLYNDYVNHQCFDIRRGEVIVLAEEVERLKTPFISIATTEGQQTRLKLVRNVIEALEAIIAQYPEAKRQDFGIPGLINTDGEVFTPSPYFVIEGKFATGTAFVGFPSVKKQSGTPPTQTTRPTPAPPTDPAAMAGYNAAQRRNATGVTAAQPGLIL